MQNSCAWLLPPGHTENAHDDDSVTHSFAWRMLGTTQIATQLIENQHTYALAFLRLESVAKSPHTQLRTSQVEVNGGAGLQLPRLNPLHSFFFLSWTFIRCSSPIMHKGHVTCACQSRSVWLGTFVFWLCSSDFERTLDFGSCLHSSQP